ncbi:MAG: GNAT family N-acetyltransferase [Anaerolineae bacterium]|nr:GNAT family N-acetyltransferase [Anaerolineae bacterium]
MTIEVREIEPEDRAWVHHFLERYAGGAQVVSRGVLHQADQLPGLIATRHGAAEGLLTYRIADREMEVVTLHAAQPGQGVGSRLIEAAREKAAALGCRRLWLITTNDNARAIRFYQRRGLTLAAVHRHAIAESRKLKPEIPMIGFGGVPIEDELEFEVRFE